MSDHPDKPIPTLEEVTDTSSWHTMLVAQVSALVFAVVGMVAAIFAIKHADKPADENGDPCAK